jgi:hypothetical protein
MDTGTNLEEMMEYFNKILYELDRIISNERVEAINVEQWEKITDMFSMYCDLIINDRLSG